MQILAEKRRLAWGWAAWENFGRLELSLLDAYRRRGVSPAARSRTKFLCEFAASRIGLFENPGRMVCMKVVPIGDHIVVKRMEAEKKSAGGIMLPETAREKPRQGRAFDRRWTRVEKREAAPEPGERRGSGVVFPLFGAGSRSERREAVDYDGAGHFGGVRLIFR